jgi:hypothetical protein
LREAENLLAGEQFLFRRVTTCREAMLQEHYLRALRPGHHDWNRSSRHSRLALHR